MSDAPGSPPLLILAAAAAPAVVDGSELYSVDSCRDPGADDIMEDDPIGDDEDEDEDEDQRLLLSLSADSTKCISPVITFIGFTSRGYMTCPPVKRDESCCCCVVVAVVVVVTVVVTLFVGDGVFVGDIVVMIAVGTSPTPFDGDAWDCSSLILWKK